MHPPVRSIILAALAVASPLATATLRADPGDLVERVPFRDVSPQDVARDADGTFWVTTLLASEVHHYSADLRTPLDVFASPFGANAFPTGVAFNSLDGTLLLAEATSPELVEVDRDGVETGRRIPLELEPVVNERGFPTVRGLAFWEGGDGGFGSIFLVESLGTLIYEVALDGRVLRRFPHPDDPDGFPGEGASANASDIDLIVEDGELTGFWVTSNRREQRLLRLEADGSYTGRSIPLLEAGGNVSGVLHTEIVAGGTSAEHIVCVVESNPRFALLDAGQPAVPELFHLSCEETAAGDGARMSWTSRDVYDRIEIVDGCHVLATLPGDAVDWEGELPADGTHRLAARAVRGEVELTTPTCTIVTGPGRVLRVHETTSAAPIDLARGPGGEIFVSEAAERILRVYADDLEPIAEIPLVLDPEELEESTLTGIAVGPGEEIWIYDTTLHRVIEFDVVGEPVRRFAVDLPDLAPPPPPGEEPEPDLGVVIGMSYDPTGDGGRGSLWVVEGVDDVVHEIDLDGRRLRSIPHPFRDVVEPPAGSPWGSASSGVAVVPGTSPTRLLLSGAPLIGASTTIVTMDTGTGAIVPGSEVPLDAVRRDAGASSVTLMAHGESSILVLPYARREAPILEIAGPPRRVAPPRHPVCRQRSLAGDVAISFTPGDIYDEVEVLRDCEPIAALAGDATMFVDADPPPGVHEYAVVGSRDGARSVEARCTLRVDVGGVLEDVFSYPARSPQQIARDPRTGDFWVANNYPGDERTIYHFDASLRFVDSREIAFEAPWEVATLAVQVFEGESLLTYIAWRQPVPLGGAGEEVFHLVTETLDGVIVDQVDIDPPRPTNGFVTFPAGLIWLADTDTLLYLERNSNTFVEMTPDGRTVRTFPHPSPPFQNFVFNLAITHDPESDLLWISGAERRDEEVTHLYAMTRAGVLTGETIPVDVLPGVVRDVAWTPNGLVACVPSSISRLLRIDPAPGAPAPFIRGDADASGAVDLTDAVRVLERLFRGAEALPCPDAADADDDGHISLTDAVAILRRLFLGGAPLAAPYPDAGQDITPDALGCS